MLTRLKSIARRATRSLVMAPLRFTGPRLRAEALEQISNSMIAEVAIPDGVIRFYAPAPLLLDRARNMLTKEVDTIRWIDSFEEGSVMWDIGANVGVFSLYGAVRRRATVLAFEPSSVNFPVLARNVQINRLADRMTAYCLAFADRSQLGVLNLASETAGSALSQFGAPGEKSRWTSKEAELVHGMIGFRLDDFIAQYQPRFPQYIKLDVDGIEIPILEGAAETLRDSRLRSVLVELDLDHDDQRRHAVSLLESAGLKLESQGAVQATDTARGANHLFVR